MHTVINNLQFDQLIWRTVGPITQKGRKHEWSEIKHEKAIKLLNEFNGILFKEVIFHFEKKHTVEVFQRKLNHVFRIKNFEFDLRESLNLASQYYKIIAIRSDNFIEIRFLFKDGKVDLGFKI